MIIALLSGCRKQPPVETTPVETIPEVTVPAETEPEVEYMTAEVNGIPAVLATFSRGDTVDLVKAFDEKHYVVKLEVGYGLVEKNLVRPEEEAPYVPWTGYAYHNAEVYDNYRLTGKAEKILATNTEVEVLDDLGHCVLVNHEGSIGYMKQELLAKNPAVYKEGNGGNSGSGKESSNHGTTGKDGGDISLRSAGKITFLATVAPQNGNARGRAEVLADGTDVVLGYFDRGDKIPVVRESAGKDQLTVCLDGLYATVSGSYVRAEGEKSYEQWEGSSQYGTKIYRDFWMQESPIDRLNADTEITVLCELENCYLVEAGGVTGYVPKDMVTPVKPEPSAPPAKIPEKNEDTNPKPAQPTDSAKEPTDGNSGNAETKPEEGKNPPPETKPTEENAGGNPGTDSGNTKTEWTPPML